MLIKSLVFGAATLVVALTIRPELSSYVYPAPFLAYVYIAFHLLSTLVNTILAALIISWLVSHRRYIRNTLGVEHGSPYTNMITMCIESSALMLIFGGLFNGLYFVSGDGEYFMNSITPHIFVGGLKLNDF